jgi:hypothetical protein
MTTSLYLAQDQVLSMIFSNLEPLGIPNCILAGGTALARFYLHHRISYDLDFFVGTSHFSPEDLSIKLGRLGLHIQDLVLEEGGHWANQLHGYLNVGKEIVKISFVEDPLYGGMWPQTSFGEVVTEEINGLYHRKLRTVSGSGQSIQTQGGRQTARDLFDLYVLSGAVQPISSFIQSINVQGANFPVEPFCAKLLGMPWLSLFDEFESLERAQAYADVGWFDEVKPALTRQAMTLQNL